MSYAIYKTEAIIIRITPNGEASLDVTFFTRDLGKIIARVQSARKHESKMRMHLIRYNHVVIYLVRGKNVWRLTGIHGMRKLDVFQNEEFLRAWYRTTSLAEHLIRGEEPHPEIFDFLVQLSETPSFRGGDTRSVTGALELFGVIHVLDMLGYWHGEKLPLIPTEEILVTCLGNKKELVKMINESIEATQIVV